MTLKLEPQWDEIRSRYSTTGKPNDIIHRYFVISDDGTESESDVAVFLRNNSPASYNNTPRTSYSVNGRIVDSPGLAVWECQVRFGGEKDKEREDPDNPEQEITVAYRSAGFTQLKKTKSIKLIGEGSAIDKNGNTDANWVLRDTDMRRAIGLKPSDGESDSGLFTVEGIDFSIGTVEVVITTLKRQQEVDAGQLLVICEAAAENVVNSEDWEGFAAGTLRITSFSAKQRAGEIDPSNTQFPVPPWELTLTMQFERNIPAPTQAQVDAGTYDHPLLIEGVEPIRNYDDPSTPEGVLVGKLGHHFLDVTSAPVEKELFFGSVQGGPQSIYATVVAPVRMAIHQIWEEKDFRGDLNL